MGNIVFPGVLPCTRVFIPAYGGEQRLPRFVGLPTMEDTVFHGLSACRQVCIPARGEKHCLPWFAGLHATENTVFHGLSACTQVCIPARGERHCLPAFASVHCRADRLMPGLRRCSDVKIIDTKRRTPAQCVRLHPLRVGITNVPKDDPHPRATRFSQDVLREETDAG